MRVRVKSVREQSKLANRNQTLARDVAFDDVFVERRAAILHSNEAPVGDALEIIVESRAFP